MINDTQIVFQNVPVGTQEGAPDKIYINKLGADANGQTSVIHSNKGGRKLVYLSILAQLSVYATQ